MNNTQIKQNGRAIAYSINGKAYHDGQRISWKKYLELGQPKRSPRPKSGYSAYTLWLIS